MLLCSDGLSNKVSADEMRDAIVQNQADLANACRRLIELANARGGEDNITALITQFDGTSLHGSGDQFTITGSMRALTSNDLLRIGGQQLDYYQNPIAASPPSVNGVLDNLGMQLIATQPGVNPIDTDLPVTHVAIPRVPAASAHADPDVVVPAAAVAPPIAPPSTQPLPETAPAPQVVAHQPAPAPAPPPAPIVPSVPPAAAAPQAAPAPATGQAVRPASHKLLITFGILLILLAVLTGVAFVVYYVMTMQNGS